jgi:hypothetical protein
MTSADPGLGEHRASDQVLASLFDSARVPTRASRAVAFVADIWASIDEARRCWLLVWGEGLITTIHSEGNSATHASTPVLSPQ